MTSADLDLCVEWAKRNGAYINDKVKFVRDDKLGILAFVSEPVNTEEELISIPKKLLITGEKSLRFFKLDKSITKNPNALLQLYLANLVYEKSPSEDRTFFQPYLNILPGIKSVNSPYFWSSNELDLFKGTDILVKIKRNLTKLVDEWYAVVSEVQAIDAADEAFYQALKGNPSLDIHDHIRSFANIEWHSFPAYLWSHYIFTSRAFPHLLLGKENLKDLNQAFLFPIVDLLNHGNGKKVKWLYSKEKDSVAFSTSEKLNAKDELFNNYGDKSNEELLLGYGFCLEKNDFDESTITLRLPANVISDAQSHGISLNSDDIIENSVNFHLSCTEALPESLVSLFAFICKLTSEKSVTTRSTLEGLDKLLEILEQKLEFFKKASKISSTSVKNPQVIKQAKIYLSTQRKIFQVACDAIPKKQKEMLKTAKPLSFKSIIKTDRQFADSLLISFGMNGYEGIVNKNFVQQALLLWIIRAANGDSGVDVSSKLISDCFADVKSSIVITKEDVQEYMSLYKSLMPDLASKIPEVYGYGDWGIKQFIIAGTVIDRLVWTRSLNREAFFFEKN
ncbi:LAFE_0D00584g1_1 [Lachancea fermentati]|uniref:LAFE_0D00584g1_1 n=1 Tax=Lachancea fermentati TaxID=4955 RepID=A0A1G4MAU6_LACFM|nr:LAFE_0D00584g1_1 [Lachancea fermentati]